MTGAWRTIPQMVFAQAARIPDRIVFQVKRQGRYEPILWRELATQVQEIALGLKELGIGPGDRVAILSENRPEWAFADLAVLSLSAVTVPIYTTLTSAEVEYILRDSQAKLLFVSHPEGLAKVVGFQAALDLKVVLFDAPFRVAGPRVWWLGEVRGLGCTASHASKEAWRKQLEEGDPEALASIIYTSGTTGNPKGVMLTHGNFISNCRAIGEVLPIGENDSTLSFLPLSHVFERTAGYYFVLMAAGKISYAQSMETVPTNLMETSPTILTAVPRFYEKMHERILAAVGEAPWVRRAIFRWAQRVGHRVARQLLSGARVGPLLAFEQRLADRIVFSKLKARLGGRIRFCVSGSAPLARDLAEFFFAAGILILEGYGLTETSPVITVNRLAKFRFGSVGLPIPGVEVKIAEDGEILTRGPHIMKGYFNNPQATAEAIDSEGWFHTGDVGAIDSDRFLKITDRKKDIIKTSGGKMVAPQNLENALKSSPLISDCVVIGDRRKYIAALLVPERSRVEAFARERGIFADSYADLLTKREVVEWIWQSVEELNRTLASYEQIKKVALLAEPFTLAGGMLTPTLKVKRRVIEEHYTSQIDSLYRE